MPGLLWPLAALAATAVLAALLPSYRRPDRFILLFAVTLLAPPGLLLCLREEDT